MKSAVIFGGGGQDAHYLSSLLKREELTVLSLKREDCDVGEAGSVESVIRSAHPDYVFHFAARSTTAHEAVRHNQRAIVDGTLNILEAVKLHAPKCKVFIAGSILQLSCRDEVAFEQVNSSIYAAQRNASVALARYYRTIGLDVYVGYFSYHDSPLRGPSHLAKRIAMEAVEVAQGKRDVIVLRDPLDEKEWNFAQDMMNAVWSQVNSPVHEAILGSGKAHTIQAYAEACLKAAGHVWGGGLFHAYTREPTVSRTDDPRFQQHFTTSLAGLAEIMVAGVVGKKP